jgi:hypothetical protein
LQSGFRRRATNWETDTNTYQVQLHCTSDTDYAVFLGYV